MAGARGYHHGDLREALLDAAVRTVEDLGIDAVKVSALARECGVSSAAPFRHFASREALLVAAAERAAAGQAQVLQRAAEAQTDPIRVQQAMGVAYVRWAVENPGEFTLLSNGAILEASAHLQRESEEFVAQLDAILGDARHSEVAPELVGRTAAGLGAQAMVYGLAKMLVDGVLGPRTPDEAERLAWEVTSLLGSD